MPARRTKLGSSLVSTEATRARRPSVRLTDKESAWEGEERKRPQNPQNQDGLVGRTAEERRALVMKRTGETMTPEQKSLLAKMESRRP